MGHMQEKAKTIRYMIAEHIDTIDLPSYLVDEAKRFLDYLNYYKLKNIYKHVSLFCDYLIYLDALYYQQLVFLLKDSTMTTIVVEVSMTADDDSYFLSQFAKQQLLNENLYHIWSDAWFDRYQLLSVIMRVKSLFLLSATEFCHASTTRLSIYNRIFKTKSQNI